MIKVPSSLWEQYAVVTFNYRYMPSVFLALSWCSRDVHYDHDGDFYDKNIIRVVQAKKNR